MKNPGMARFIARECSRCKHRPEGLTEDQYGCSLGFCPPWRMGENLKSFCSCRNADPEELQDKLLAHHAAMGECGEERLCREYPSVFKPKDFKPPEKTKKKRKKRKTKSAKGE